MGKKKKTEKMVYTFRIMKVDDVDILITRRVLRSFKNLDLPITEVLFMIRKVYEIAVKYNFDNRVNIILQDESSGIMIGANYTLIDKDKTKFVIKEIYLNNGLYCHMRNKFDFRGPNGGYIPQMLL